MFGLTGQGGDPGKPLSLCQVIVIVVPTIDYTKLKCEHIRITMILYSIP